MVWNKLSKLSFEQTVEWILSSKGGVVLCCTLNEMMMAEKDKSVSLAMARANLLTPDGMPLVWYLRRKYGKGERVYGPDVMRTAINDKRATIKHMFVGDEKNKKYFEKYGKYVVLPFKKRFDEDDYKKVSALISKSKARIIWLGLGAKKQILVADELNKRLPNRVYITVGAGFDFLSGNIIQAPLWIRRIGGEWLFRIFREPRRLLPRYLNILGWLVNKLINFFNIFG